MDQTSTTETMPSRSCAENVTVHNFHHKAMAYVTANDLWWKSINPVDDPQQWGAWWGYRKDKKMGLSFMRSRAKAVMEVSNKAQRAKLGFTVPAMLPSEFDADRDWTEDKEAGDWFMNKIDDERTRREEADAAWAAKTPEERQIFINKATRGIVSNVECS